MRRLLLCLALFFPACLTQGGSTGTDSPGAVSAGAVPAPAPSMAGAATADPSSPEPGGGYPVDLPADNPPMAGPGIDPEGDKPRCWFDQGAGNRLVLLPGNGPPSIAIASAQPMGEGGETVDLFIAKKAGEEFVPVADDENISKADLDPGGFLRFTFIGNSVGDYFIRAEGSRCYAIKGISVVRGVIAQSPPEGSSRVRPSGREAADRPAEGSESEPVDDPLPVLQFNEGASPGRLRIIDLGGSGKTDDRPRFRTRGDGHADGSPEGDGVIEARDVNCSREDMVPGNCCYECAKPASKFHRRCGCGRD